MDKKKGFTLVEILIVIMIIGILFVAFKSLFQVNNKDILYSQACVENIYGEINNFVQAGLHSKVMYSGDIRIFPDKYVVSFNTYKQEIELLYTQEANTHIYKSITWTGNTANYCTNNSYMIMLTWDNYRIHINKGWEENNNFQTFYLSDIPSISNGWNTFLMCDRWWTWCQEIARLQSDTRIMSINKYMCLHLDNNGICSEWDN